jgi:hypothetical protein
LVTSQACTSSAGGGRSERSPDSLRFRNRLDFLSVEIEAARILGRGRGMFALPVMRDREMYDYCLYFISPTLGYFEREHAFDAINDEVAIGIAERHAGRQPLELWCAGRLVRRFPEVKPVLDGSRAAA